MKCIIAGGRDFDDYELLKSKCDYYLSNKTYIEIVSGRCDRGTLTYVTTDFIKVYGADGLGERYAAERGYPVTAFPADWEQFGKGAGVVRNKKMAEYGDALILFWNGKSNGSFNMKEEAAKQKLVVKIVNY